MLKPKKNSKKPGGTFISTGTGKLIRTTPTYQGVYGVSAEIKSIDTTGYSKGKKGFVLKTNSPSEGKSFDYVPRAELKKVISNLKSGSTRSIKYKS